MGKNYFLNGVTDLLILSILDKQDSYMYEIVKSITDYSGGLLSISQNTIYTAAYKLENDGKISEYSILVGKKRTRVYYRLEPKGKEYLNELSESYRGTTEGIHRIFSTLEEIEPVVVPVEEGVDTNVEECSSDIYVGDRNAVSDKTSFGTFIPKKPCFGY